MFRKTRAQIQEEFFRLLDTTEDELPLEVQEYPGMGQGIFIIIILIFIGFYILYGLTLVVKVNCTV
jgi:hypothetical protein